MLKFLTTAFFAVLSIPEAYAVATVTTEIFDPCTDQERIRLNESIPTEFANPLRELISEKPEGVKYFEYGDQLSKTTSDPELKEIADYVKARAYFREGLYQIAYGMFQNHLLKPFTKSDSMVARAASVGCIIQIQKKIPSFNYSNELSSRIRELMNRPESSPYQKEHFSQALVIRMKELMSQWDDQEVQRVLETLKMVPQYHQYAQAMVYQRQGKKELVLPLWQNLIERKQLPAFFAEDRDIGVLMYARTLFEAKKFDKSGGILRLIPRDSNYLAAALSELSWALLLSGRRKEAVGSAFNIQKSLLNRVYAPEAPLVASMALFEMCQYARALKNTVFFKKKYYPLLLWYKNLKPEQQEKPYALLVDALKRKGGIPNVVLLEWLRSPEYRAHQAEANLLFDEKKKAYQLYTKRVKAGKSNAWVKEWKRPLPLFYNSVVARQKQIGKKMDAVLAYLTKKMVRQVARIVENVQMLEVEIYDAAGEDMVWRNVNTEYLTWLEDQEKDKRSQSKFWDWGKTPVNPNSKDEVWEDELGWTLADVDDECKLKKKFKDDKTK